MKRHDDTPTAIAKCPTGIAGFDEITLGGLPRGRTSLIAGGAGSGKTLFGMEFLVRGAREHGEPGVFVSFEESSTELTENVASLGFDLAQLVTEGKLVVDQVEVVRSEIVETGVYDLEGLFIRLGAAIDSIGAQRVVLDTIEVLFAAFADEGILRSELQRLFRWLKARGVTTLVTCEQGDGTITRHGIEEYVSDCVIAIDQRVRDQIATRRLRVVKYRGTSHGANEYPFLIDSEGFSVLPITSLHLDHPASAECVSTGIGGLDAMLGAGGYYRGSSILVSGAAGTGKSSVGAAFVHAACRRGERALYVLYEESPAQFIRNMRSIGIDLEPMVQEGLLRLHATRPQTYGLELQLLEINRIVDQHAPAVTVVDPVTSLEAISSESELKAALTRLVDSLKSRGTTAVLTSLDGGVADVRSTHLISSLADVWLHLRDLETAAERNRVLYVLKARGMAHSNQVREFLLTGDGIELVEPYVGPGGMFTGTERRNQELKDAQERLRLRQDVEARERACELRRVALIEQIASLNAELEGTAAEIAAIRSDHAELLGTEEVAVAERRATRVYLRDGAHGDPERSTR